MTGNETPQDQAEATDEQSEAIGFTIATRLALIGAILASPVLLYQDCNSEDQKAGEDMITFEPGEMPYPFPAGTVGMPGQQPKGKTMKEYLMHQLKPKKPNDPEFRKGLAVLLKKSQWYYDKDLKKAKKKYHLIEKSGKYVTPKAKKVLKPKLAKKGRKLDEEYFVPFMGVNGKTFNDTRFGEEVWGSLTAVELIMEANTMYYNATKDDVINGIKVSGDQFVFAAGTRSPERQAISQALNFHVCKGKWGGLKGLISDYTSFIDCGSDIKSEVGSCFGSSHHPGFAFDLKYGKMRKPKLAREILDKLGFTVGCKKDLPHVDLAKNKCW